MSRGRKPNADPPTEWYISLPSTLAAKVELLLYDPVTQKAQYGGRSGLIQTLLRTWVEGKIRENLTPDQSSAIMQPQVETQEQEL